MVSAVSFRSFRFDVSPFSTCRFSVAVTDFSANTAIKLSFLYF